MSDLPGPELAALIRPHTGEPTGIRPVRRGGNAVTALVEGEHGEFFVKAVPNRPGGRRESLVREGLINQHVRHLSPAVLWQAESPEWVALGFEAVQGGSADFTPGSPDLPAVTDMIRRIGALGLPDLAAGWVETRWDRYTDRPDLLRGDALLYTDIQPDNILIGDGNMWAVDWAWPTRGAAFIDPALLIVQLIAAGHSMESAEEMVADCPAWASADPDAVREFAAAHLRMQLDHARRLPGEKWIQAMVEAVRGWADRI